MAICILVISSIGAVHLWLFDGIEFNPSFHWIDVLSDAAFLAMDLIARGHEEFSRLFVNAYLERTGDYTARLIALVHGLPRDGSALRWLTS